MLPLTIAGLAVAMLGHRFLPLTGSAISWLELALGTPVVLWAGWPFFVRCAQSIRNASPNMWTLIGIGVGAAYVFSVVATIAPGLFPDAFRAGDRVGVYFEAASVIVSLTLRGQVLELRARSQTSAAIRALLGLQPKTARRIREDGTEEDVPLVEVHVGDVLRVRPGEKVPVDGAVVEGGWRQALTREASIRSPKQSSRRQGRGNFRSRSPRHSSREPASACGAGWKDGTSFSGTRCCCRTPASTPPRSWQRPIGCAQKARA